MTTSTTSRPGRIGRTAALSALALAVSGVLTACGGDPGPDVRMDNAAIRPAGQAAAPMKRSEPTRVQIPSAGVDSSPVLPLGLTGDGELDVPPVDKADKAGWFTKGVTPGEKGPAVLVAHYDTARGPALMKNVKKMKAGDVIKVGRADGSTATFKIREVQQVDKKDFPTDKVYGDTDRPELRLLTCGGPIVDGHRSDNIVFYADLVK
ncbi:peptidase C60 [Streptomyces griseoflavus]|uniref:class F sortase n=1 Tax=Streptomyces rimosus TaxID=1927 RepID=UPI00067B3EE9|nr:class F sortase [Streptomyces rimosus]KOG66741.1 peptidase C60 [Streptomyces griseoflavus]